jgi:hypothetical protein
MSPLRGFLDIRASVSGGSRAPAMFCRRMRGRELAFRPPLHFFGG